MNCENNDNRHVTESLIQRVDMLPLPGLHYRQIDENELQDYTKRIGTKIYYPNDLPKDFLSVLTYANSVPIIIINAKLPNYAKWFLLGHQLGHLLLHPHLDIIDLVDSKKTDKFREYGPVEFPQCSVLEQEANYFSICTFIPLKIMVEMHTKNQLSIDNLCNLVINKFKLEEASEVLKRRMQSYMEAFNLRVKIKKLIFNELVKSQK